MKQLIVISPDGTVSTQVFDTEPKLKDLQDAVGGYIQDLPHFPTYEGQPCVVYANEDGRNLDLPFNKIASDLWNQHHGQSWKTNDRARLFGNIAIVQDLPEVLWTEDTKSPIL